MSDAVLSSTHAQANLAVVVVFSCEISVKFFFFMHVLIYYFIPQNIFSKFVLACFEIVIFFNSTFD